MASMIKTRHPGVYKRGSRYVVRYRAGGKHRQESARTLDAALRLKRALEADRDRGEFDGESRLPFREYAEEWIERYRGNGRRGFTENTRKDYRRDLRRYAYPFFDGRLGRTVSQITPRDVDRWIAWLCDPGAQGRVLADGSVRRILCPLRSCLATAEREGLIRHNPTARAVLPNREKVEEREAARALTREELASFLRIVRADHRLMFRFIAATGLRWSELVGLRWLDLRLDGSEPHVRVRRAIVRGRLKPPKSKHSRRDVPLDAGIVFELRRRRAESGRAGDDDLVFAANNGAPLHRENMSRRVLKPAAEEAGVGWASFHTFRHTCASLLFARGKNAKQVQRWLGHHAASFTLDTYTHLLDDGIGEPLDLDAELESANKARTYPDGNDQSGPESLLAETAV